MEKVLERYERYSYAERQLNPADLDSHGSWTLEHAKLKARMDILQTNQRHYEGENLESLSLKELQNLERQLDSALKNIRSRKNQVMFESISLHQKKDKALQDENNKLAKKIKEREKEIAEWETTQNDDMNSAPYGLPQHLLNSFNLSERYNCGGVEYGEMEGNLPQQQPNTVMPQWMLSHINGYIK
ncbi:unnamed protein product [Cuscuta campestris]|uniref:K-box domain-containing protein n=1 Tax=Cuscuta campestris TaxID=132261 RepID=A0A484LF78_9ASTE|nr:unnamed protein product [Cuscuta campestris]